MGTAKAQSLRCFSRTHLDGGTQLTGCTQPPGNLGLAPHHRDRRPCTTCVVAGHHGNVPHGPRLGTPAAGPGVWPGLFSHRPQAAPVGRREEGRHPF